MKFIRFKDENVNSFIKSQLRKIINIVTEKLPDTISIVLSGSFSRAEGSIIRLDEDNFMLHKDFDIFIFSRKIPTRHVYDSLKKSIYQEIQSSNKKNFKNIDFQINLEFISISKIKKLPPDISTYELKKNGKVIYGKNILKMIPSSVSNFNSSTILRILLNKLIGLLENHPDVNKNPINCLYECHKTYIEINTTICILLNSYSTSYYSRFLSLKKKWSQVPNIIRNEIPDLLIKIEKALDFKLNPIDVTKIKAQDGFWYETKNDLIKILILLSRFFLNIKNQPINEKSLLIYLHNYYYFPYSQSILSKFKIKSQFLNHFLSRLYVISEDLKTHSYHNLISTHDLIIQLYLTSFYLLNAIEENNRINKDYFLKAKSILKIKDKEEVSFKSWEKLARLISHLRNERETRKIRKKTLVI
ncbi:MAG: hypothetical protein ACTSVY_01730 [Candidatus Helarchaeota archaeon]